MTEHPAARGRQSRSGSGQSRLGRARAAALGFGLGATVKLQTSEGLQVREINNVASYLSSNDTRLHFGLGNQEMMREIDIAWPSGMNEVLHNLPADFLYTVVEGQGIQDKQALNSASQAKAPAAAISDQRITP